MQLQWYRCSSVWRSRLSSCADSRRLPIPSRRPKAVPEVAPSTRPRRKFAEHRTRLQDLPLRRPIPAARLGLLLEAGLWTVPSAGGVHRGIDARAGTRAHRSPRLRRRGRPPRHGGRSYTARSGRDRLECRPDCRCLRRHRSRRRTPVTLGTDTRGQLRSAGEGGCRIGDLGDRCRAGRSTPASLCSEASAWPSTVARSQTPFRKRVTRGFRERKDTLAGATQTVESLPAELGETVLDAARGGHGNAGCRARGRGGCGRNGGPGCGVPEADRHQFARRTRLTGIGTGRRRDSVMTRKEQLVFENTRAFSGLPLTISARRGSFTRAP